MHGVVGRSLNSQGNFLVGKAMQKITPFLWFNGEAEDAAKFYVSVFKNSRIVKTNYFLEGSPAKPGSVMTVEFILDGVEFVALNGGPEFKFSPAISFVANCQTQEEVDYLWRELSAGGQEIQCGWLTDKFGVTWQVTPTALIEMITSSDKPAAQRAFTAMMTMTKFDIAALKRAYDGK
jgi:predicted 3-demethylubiquinone-9 3-methyltransferase (glyoxalase superfamily)